MPLRTVFHIGHVLFAGVIAGDGRGLAFGGLRNGLAFAGKGSGGEAVELEIVLEALDLFLLAIHVVDVVAEEEIETLRSPRGRRSWMGSNWKRRS